MAEINTVPISVLERVRRNGKVWQDLCEHYGVDNADPPWKVNLEGICDALDEQSCALPPLERRNEEDILVDELYSDIPFPERQLLALAHSMIKRGLINEDELEKRMSQVSKRLNE